MTRPELCNNATTTHNLSFVTEQCHENPQLGNAWEASTGFGGHHLITPDVLSVHAEVRLGLSDLRNSMGSGLPPRSGRRSTRKAASNSPSIPITPDRSASFHARVLSSPPVTSMRITGSPTLILRPGNGDSLVEMLPDLPSATAPTSSRIAGVPVRARAYCFAWPTSQIDNCFWIVGCGSCRKKTLSPSS